MAMTATSTRSTRRAEGLAAHHSDRPGPPPRPISTQMLPQSQTQRATRHHQHHHLQQSNSSRPLKRLHEATNLAYDIKPPKKAKFEIEIPSKSQYQARLYPENNESRQHQQRHHLARPARGPSVTAAHNTKPPKHDLRHHAAAAPPPPALAPEPVQTAQKAQATIQDQAPQNNIAIGKDSTPGSLTKHQAKVVNGIKHELDRLQPSSADVASSSGSQGRKLRSQEGVRYKSELSAYFPEYDEVIGNIPKESHVLMIDTPIVVTDSSRSSSSTTSLPRLEHHPAPSTFVVRTYNDDLFTNLNDSHIVDLSWLESQYKGKTLRDPLPDSYYESIHRKESRNEKITRNAEKGRSQHEKEQVIRLLDGLKGPDWLKTMGVSGITESKKRQFEPARAHFVQKCEAVLDKFRKWAAEEKRLKLEKERAAKCRASQETASLKAEDEEAEEVEESEGEDVSDDEQGEEDDGKESDVEGDGSDLPDSDPEAPAKQLYEEAMARSQLAAKSSKRRPVIIEEAPPPPTEFKSFFKKPYQRDAALSKSRRRGRTILAWGQPVPEPEVQDFELPAEFRDEETMKARERRLRQLRRGSRNRN